MSFLNKIYNSLGIVNVMKDKIYSFVWSMNNSSTYKEVDRIYEKIPFVEQYRYFLMPASHIIDNIYLGSAFNASNLLQLNNQNIKCIVNVTSEISNYYENYNEGFEYYNYNVLDSNMDSINSVFEPVMDVLEKNKDKNILVHCFMGSSRSAVIVLLYLIKVKNFSFDYALEYLKKKRKIVNINTTFFEELKNYLNDNTDYEIEEC